MFCQSCGASVAPGATFCNSCGKPVSGQAGAPAAAVPATAGVPVVAAGVRYAGFWLRFVALIIDGIVLNIASYILLAFFGIFGLAVGFDPGRIDRMPPGAVMGMMFPVIGLSIAINWLYYALMESSPWQATLGKKALGLAVTDLNGNRISFARATGRFFGKIVSSLILMIGYLMAGFTARKQALHDMLADCLVIRRS